MITTTTTTTTMTDSTNSTNSSSSPLLTTTNPAVPLASEYITNDDATWILSNAFLILTMQTGFGMLEAGNAFCGFGSFFATSPSLQGEGSFYTHYVFQFSFCTAATTIVSGAVAERIRLESYMLYSAINVLVYCFPASWVWNDTGFLHKWGFYDFAGACVVHLSGGASALVAACMVGPRTGRFEKDSGRSFGITSPTDALVGTFMLWWAWLAFNCGSTFGVAGNLWKTSAKAAVNTLNGSIGGSLVGLVLGYLMTWKTGKYLDISIIITSILGGLVGITAGCSVYTPAESLLIGVIGALVAVITTPLMEQIRVDDPVGAVPVHFFAATWSTLAVGLFGKNDYDILQGHNGLFKGGGFYLLGVQIAGILLVGAWSMLATLLSLWIMTKTIGLRMDIEDEILGADLVEHHVKSENFAIKLEQRLGDIDYKHEEIIIDRLLMELGHGKAFKPNLATRIGSSRNRKISVAFVGRTSDLQDPPTRKAVMEGSYSTGSLRTTQTKISDESDRAKLGKENDRFSDFNDFGGKSKSAQHVDGSSSTATIIYVEDNNAVAPTRPRAAWKVKRRPVRGTKSMLSSTNRKRRFKIGPNE